MTAPRQLRSDLVVSLLPDGEGCRVLDPLTDESYELGPVERFLFEQLRGAYSTQQVAERCNARFGTAHTAADIEGFIGLLANWGFLVPEPDEAEVLEAAPEDEAPSPPRAAADDTSAIDYRQPNRWHLFEPAAALDAWLRALSHGRFLVWLTPLVLVLGVLTVIFNYRAFMADLTLASDRFGLLGRLAIAAFTVNIISQWTRGLVARHFGLATPSFGLLLLFGLMPRFNMQILPSGGMSRAAKMWLAATSSLVRFWMFGLTTLLWAVTRSSGSSLASVAIEVGQLSLVSLLFVGNPLWRGGDGATFLSAWLDQPNIQKRWTSALKDYFVRQPAVVARYRKRSLWLGLLGLAVLGLFTFALGYFAFKIFTFLEATYSGAGVVLFLALAGYIAYNVRRQSVAREEKALAKKAEMGRGGRPAGASGTAQLGGQRSVKKDEPRRVPWLRYLLLIGLLICLFLPYRYETGGSAEVLPNARATITAEMDGTLEAIHFNGGEQVEAGTVIAQIADYRQASELKQLEANVAAKKFEIERYLTTPSKESIRLSEQQVESARMQSEYSDAAFVRQEQLAAQGFVSAQAVEDSRNTAVRDRQKRIEAEAALVSLKAQINPNQIAELEAEVVKLQHEADLYKEQLRRTRMKSPIAGRIITKDLKFQLNAFLEAGKVFAEVEDTRTVLLRIAVPEADVGELVVGAPLTAKVWAYPDRNFKGQVSEIQPATEETDFGQVVYVTGRLDNPDGLLVSGMTGQAKVTGHTTVALLAFTKALYRFVTIEMWSWLP